MPQTSEGQDAKPEIEITYCSHDQAGRDYSLDIAIEDRHIDLSTYSWPHQKRYRGKIVIFDLTVEDITKLGEAILETALRIQIDRSPKKGETQHADTKAI